MHKHEAEVSVGPLDVTLTEAPVKIYMPKGQHESVIVGEGTFQKDEKGVNILIKLTGEQGEVLSEYIQGQLAGFSVISIPGRPEYVGDPAEQTEQG